MYIRKFPQSLISFFCVRSDQVNASVVTDCIAAAHKSNEITRQVYTSKEVPLEAKQLARLVLTPPASSAACERMFSGAGLLDGPLRRRMAPKTLERLITLRSCLQMHASDLPSYAKKLRAQISGDVHTMM